MREANKEMSEPRASVAMATYNGERFLQEQLDSFVAQLHQPDELVVTDDGSTDDTLKVLGDFQSSSPFEVKIYRNAERLGFSRNFEKALSLCSGEVIFLSDQDDVWFPNKIMRVISNFAGNPQIMVIANDQIMTDENLSHQGVTLLTNIRSLGLKESLIGWGCCTAIRREWRDVSLPVPADDVTHDCWLNGLADPLNARLILLEPLQFYRRHGGTTTSSSWFLSSPKKASVLDVVRVHGLRDARTGWRRETRTKELYRQRLSERAATLRSLQLEGARQRAIEQLDHEILAIERRIGLMDLPRWRRMPAVFRFFMEGGYSNFMGWKSALKDVLR